MFARAIVGVVVLGVLAGCSPKQPAFTAAQVCAGDAPWAEAEVFHMGDPGVVGTVLALRDTLAQRPETPERDAAIAELTIFAAAVWAGRDFSEQAATRESSVRSELAQVRIWLAMGSDPGLVERLARRDDLAEPMQQLLADEQGARKLGELRQLLTAGKLAESAGSLAAKMAALAESTRRITVDGDHAHAEEMLTSPPGSLTSSRDEFERSARRLDELGGIEGDAEMWLDRPLRVWTGLVVVTARLADRWPDSIGATRQRVVALPDGWAVTCIDPTTAALPPDIAAALPTLVAARDTLGAALAILPTTAPSPPPTADAVLAVLPPEN